MPPKRRQDRPKKRKFHGNRFSKENDDQNEPETIGKPPQSSKEEATASSRKIGPNFGPRTDDSELQGHRFIHIQTVANFITDSPCKQCGSYKPKSDRERHSKVLPSYTVTESVRGISSALSFTCDYCGDLRTLDFSPRDNLNLRFQYSMYSIGISSVKSRRFLANMNMPAITSSTQCQVFRGRIQEATKKVAEESMKKAAEELKNATGSEDVAVSCDGTWQKRGFVSKNGISTVLTVNPAGASKVIDVAVMTNYCHSCKTNKMKMTEEEFAVFKQSHLCSQNHYGTSGSMETEGVLKIFKRSEEKFGLRYTEYLGDGDSKSYKSVSESGVYKNKVIKKLECCGHVQKRMGKRLMDKVAACRGKKYKEGSKTYTGIGGAGRLTSKAIKRIQGHYGGAIRKNKGDLEGMRNSIMAIWHHRGDNHSHCGDWCNGETKNKLPPFVLKEILPIFQNLSSDELLSKCLHGGTQNNNESFHNLIWNRCPKSTFVGRERLEISTYDAAIVFNEGELGRLDIFEKLNLEVGKYVREGLKTVDSNRIKSSVARYDPKKKAPKTV